MARLESRAAEQLDGADPASCGLGSSRSILELAGRLISMPLCGRSPAPNDGLVLAVDGGA